MATADASRATPRCGQPAPSTRRLFAGRVGGTLAGAPGRSHCAVQVDRVVPAEWPNRNRISLQRLHVRSRHPAHHLPDRIRIRTRKGTYFDELIVCYLRNEATYRNLYSDVWTHSERAKLQGLAKRDAGIHLVAKTQGTGEIGDGGGLPGVPEPAPAPDGRLAGVRGCYAGRRRTISSPSMSTTFTTTMAPAGGAGSSYRPATRSCLRSGTSATVTLNTLPSWLTSIST